MPVQFSLGDLFQSSCQTHVNTISGLYWPDVRQLMLQYLQDLPILSVIYGKETD